MRCSVFSGVVLGTLCSLTFTTERSLAALDLMSVVAIEIFHRDQSIVWEIACLAFSLLRIRNLQDSI